MKYIASFDEIAPLSDQVRVRGGYVLVNALELNQLGALIYKHAALQAAFGDSKEKTDLFQAIISGGKEVVHDLVRAATGREGNISNLSASEQANIILCCLALTIPETDDEVADFLDQFAVFRARALLAVQMARAKGMVPQAKKA
ncbi:hypothetical protein [Ruixingdingia sedimenti]|uniref:Uncharacterized protein n=1 Tax=Ruixingdingia sedimenti TaxID=3073604 RepID=A0ABU1FEH7_9RHOB|nr:hypothetical protein [Xinfangfangia sp. LG-4]MDR5654879.1 hypothetical protein [Xinfangfangia sp. LG-4]